MNKRIQWQMPQDIVDYHCKYIRDHIKANKPWIVDHVNWLKNHASNELTRKDWHWIGAQLVMSGWLTVNDNNDFVVKG